MNPQFGVIAAEAREEIAFWPIAAGGYLFVQTESWFVFIILLLVIIPAAVSYLFLKQLRQLVKSQSELSLDRPGSNSEELPKQVEHIVDNLEEAGLRLNPMITGVYGILSGILYIQIVRRIFTAGSPDLITVGLFLIPLVT